MLGFRGIEGGRGSEERITTRVWLFNEDPSGGDVLKGWDVSFCEPEQWTTAGGLGLCLAVALMEIVNERGKLSATKIEVMPKTPQVRPGDHNSL